MEYIQIAQNIKQITQDSIKHPGLSSTGRKWLTAALDPYHDTPIGPVSLPDINPEPSVCQVTNHSIQLSAPGGTVGNWAAHVFSTPLLQEVKFQCGAKTTGEFAAIYKTDPDPAVSTNRTLTIIEQAGNPPPAPTFAPDIFIGPLTVHAWNTDVTTLFPNPAVTYATPTFQDTIGGTESLGSTRMRPVAMGFEVVNTTASLYQQGSITCYRVPTVKREETVFCSASPFLVDIGAPGTLRGSGEFQPISTTVLDGPPSNPSDAMAYNGTAQWHAREGAYVVCTQSGNGDYQVPQQSYLQMKSGESAPATRTAISTPGSFAVKTQFLSQPNGRLVATATALNFVSLSGSGQLQSTSDFDVSGLMLTGLSKESTFQVNLKIYWELAPRISDQGYQQLVYSLSPPAPHDPVALEIYQHVARSLPPGVIHAMNPAGEYWRLVLNILRDIARGALTGLATGKPLQAAVVASVAKTVIDRVKPFLTEGSQPAKAKPVSAPQKGSKTVKK